MTIDAFPLSWPADWPRTKSYARKDDRFRSKSTRELTIADAAGRVVDELHRFGVHFDDVIVSTNVKPRLDGLPRTGERIPEDPGAAVYWKHGRNKAPRVMAIDIYKTVAGNLAAIAATLDAMRAIERHGGAQILERAFTGFVALPAPGGSTHWRDVFGVGGGPVDAEGIRDLYRRLASLRHPDRGGSHEAMSQLNAARDAALQEIGGSA